MDKKKLWPGKISDVRQEPTEIACIWVKKIYDACSQRECEEFFFEDLNFPSGAESFTVECFIKPCSESFSDWSIEPIDDGPLGIVRVRVCAVLKIIIRDAEDPSNYTVNWEEVCFWKEVILYAPDPIHMQVLVESIFEALTCEIVEENGNGEIFSPTVVATIGAFIVVKTALKVQLLVPAFGFCPTPPECEELGDVCEQFLERPFPPFFPPQLSDLEG
ncbi:MAG: hypothetical protein ACOX21_04885 [Bacillota bacterium]|jgi:hypothetical protein|nr:hypothetical protein [Bacillota bacterium]HPZ22416.1 hypothetical protein [Bacillota bacterium]HQD20288.1 hypothetical protein [Bacillota bacterium]